MTSHDIMDLLKYRFPPVVRSSTCVVYWNCSIILKKTQPFYDIPRFFETHTEAAKKMPRNNHRVNNKFIDLLSYTHLAVGSLAPVFGATWMAMFHLGLNINSSPNTIQANVCPPPLSRGSRKSRGEKN